MARTEEVDSIKGVSDNEVCRYWVAEKIAELSMLVERVIGTKKEKTEVYCFSSKILL